MIFKRFLRSKPEEDIAWSLYGAIVDQARQDRLFSELAIPDSVDGRFESIVLHLVLVLRRLRRDFPDGEDLAAALQEAFIADMDRSLREMGAGDLGVGKRVQRMAEALLGRLAVYEAALDSLGSGGEEDLKAALLRNVFGTLPPESVDPTGLLSYVLAQAAELERLDGPELRQGKLVFAAIQGAETRG